MSTVEDARTRLEAAIAKLPKSEGTASIKRALFSVDDVRTLLAASRREPSEPGPWDRPDGCFGHCDPEGWYAPCKGVKNSTQNSEPSDTDERWEYGYYDSDDANDPARVFHQYVQGWSFPTAEAAKHTGDKNVFGKAIIVRRHPASDWEVCDEH